MDRRAAIEQFVKRNAKKPVKSGRITEDDPRWDPKTMGNKRGSLSRGPLSAKSVRDSRNR